MTKFKYVYVHIYFRSSPESIARGDSLGDPNAVLYDRTFESVEEPKWLKGYFDWHIEGRLKQLHSYGCEAWSQTTRHPGAYY